MLLNIYTDDHIEELTRWACENGLRAVPGYVQGEQPDEKWAEQIPCLLEDAILNKNPITKQNTNLRAGIKSKVFADFRREITGDLTLFLAENDCLNVEGYINFRLRNYANLVDLVLYSAIKKYLD